MHRPVDGACLVSYNCFGAGVCMCACLCVYVCLPPRLIITSDIKFTLYDWLTKFYSCYMANVVGIVDGRGLDVDTCRGNCVAQ